MLTRRMAKRQHCPLMPTTKTYKYHANGAGIAYEVIEYGRYMGEGTPSGGTETITEKYALMKKTAGKIVLAPPILTTAAAVPIPNATAAAEADHARLRRSEPPGMGGQA